MLNNKSCSICSSLVIQEINAALLRKERLRDLEKRSGFSRAALSRHSRNCIARDSIAEHKSKKAFNYRTQLIWTEWPDGSLNVQAIPHDFQGTVGNAPGPDDLIIKVSFESPEIKNATTNTL
jgi:hypothetical protein